MKIPKKKPPVKARKMHLGLSWNPNGRNFRLYESQSGAGGERAGAVFVIAATQGASLQIHRQIKVAIDQEDGTGNGFDHCAWAVMRSIGITDLTWKQFWKLLVEDRHRNTPPTK